MLVETLSRHSQSNALAVKKTLVLATIAYPVTHSHRPVSLSRGPSLSLSLSLNRDLELVEQQLRHGRAAGSGAVAGRPVLGQWGTVVGRPGAGRTAGVGRTVVGAMDGRLILGQWRSADVGRLVLT